MLARRLLVRLLHLLDRSPLPYGEMVDLEAELLLLLLEVDVARAEPRQLN